jgi:hypothetical protein
MYLKCAHPDCAADFDYGQGRFFRFQQFPRQEPSSLNSHGVKHFWLCTRCCETFTIDYQSGVGVLLRQRLDVFKSMLPSHFVLQDESGADRKRSQCHGRRMVRERKRNSESLSGQTKTIEILENRNLERRG